MRSMFVDDIRMPKQKYSLIVRNIESAKTLLEKYGCCNYISFDNDMGTPHIPNSDGYDLAKWIINKDLDIEGEFIPLDFNWNVHSSNTVACDAINGLFMSYLYNSHALKERFMQKLNCSKLV